MERFAPLGPLCHPGHGSPCVILSAAKDLYFSAFNALAPISLRQYRFSNSTRSASA